MMYLMTDFGNNDIYVGQLKAALLRTSPVLTIIDLLHGMPDQDVLAGAHLLAAVSSSLSGQDDVFLAIVDPGVGGSRRPSVLKADHHWFVGPDNGLLSVVKQRASTCQLWEIAWRPEVLSDSFHGRDLFAPVAAMLASGRWWDGALKETTTLDHAVDATDLHQVIYLDHYGNAYTGIRRGVLSKDHRLSVGGHELCYARTFSEVPEGALFWYENSIGLIEIAANCARASALLGLSVGSEVSVIR